MLISYKYRAYPDAITRTRLNTALDTCRWLYNTLLEECTTAREAGVAPTMRGMQARIVTLKEENPFLKDVYSKVLQMVNYTLWSNLRALSQTKKKGRKIGKLRFKSASRYRTLNYNQSGFKINREYSTITFSKIGAIPFRMHRPYSGDVKGVLITRSGDRWYVIVQAEQTVSASKREGRSVGIDVGLNSFVVDSDGTVIENPRFYERSLDRIKKLQQSIARKKRLSQNWKKAKYRLEKVYEHITNQKNDFLHKLSRQYVDTYATICVEDLNIKYLKEKDKSRGLRRSIHDASWGRFYSYLAYKAESAGTTVIQIDPRDTTQMCSNCGSIVKKSLSERVHECPYCGFVADRDYNAAVNIHRVGMEQPFEPVEMQSISQPGKSSISRAVEMIPLHHISVMQVLSMKQEAPPFRAG
ncbi:IS200/IS605 family element transposase accessory protein TnpB [Methanoculleus sp. FWC-SCC3]|uniref:IS200/IS605 family element transposase accessory protein TnpB n=1 Tax=Methanoculleus methanifontis TaxID=2584086 RepID=A0ABT8M3U7_9EURY|nr:transposase [Methanoculleus sp. FWC-SCC3]MDN7013301.1 IS200/IS605 family element transposase accessory protein TnpB [Methanoculleus sp. FWC-SCC3]